MSEFECSICLEFYSGVENDYFVRTHCGHVFHNCCIKENIKASGKNVCPQCRSVFKKDFLPLRGIDPTHRQKKFKIVVLGDAGVGKTCLSRKYANGEYDDFQPPTIGEDFWVKDITVGPERIKLNIWDTSGQEVFKAITPQFVRNSQGIIIVYDTTHYSTLANVATWYDFANMYAPHAIKILVGAKADLKKCNMCYHRKGDADCRSPTQIEKQEFADTFGMYAFETSAKNGMNIDVAFKGLIGQILQNKFLLRQARILHEPKNYGRVHLGEDEEQSVEYDTKCSC